MKVMSAGEQFTTHIDGDVVILNVGLLSNEMRQCI